jgi:hypothetical protein
LGKIRKGLSNSVGGIFRLKLRAILLYPTLRVGQILTLPAWIQFSPGRNHTEIHPEAPLPQGDAPKQAAQGLTPWAKAAIGNAKKAKAN